MTKDKVKKAKAAPAASSEKVAKKKAAFISLEDKDAVATKKAKTPYSERRAIVYVSHLPHGFYEKQLRDYLGQFGAITNLRLGRSTKTGGSKGYAFVEFKYPEVAKIVADTMNNYLMFDKLVKCEVIPADRMSKACFRGKVNPDNPPAKQARYEAKKQINALRTEEQNNARLKKQLKKLEKVKAKLEAAGMTVDMQFEKKMKASSGKKSAKGTPLMEIDTEESEVKMKTPANVRKVKSRGNSAAATPLSSKNATPKGITPKMKKAAAELEPRDLVMQQVAEKLKSANKKGSTPKRLQPGTPKSEKKETPKAQQKAATPKSAVKGTPKAQQQQQQKKSPGSGKKGTPKMAQIEQVTPKSNKKNKGGMNSKSNSPAVKTPKSGKKK